MEGWVGASLVPGKESGDTSPDLWAGSGPMKLQSGVHCVGVLQLCQLIMK